MFDIGFSELILLAILGLLVLGPKRLPKAARMVGAALRRARASWLSVKSELEQEIEQADLKEALKQTTEEFRRAGKDLDSAARRDLIDPLEKAAGEARQAARLPGVPPRSGGQTPATAADRAAQGPVDSAATPPEADPGTGAADRDDAARGGAGKDQDPPG